MKAVSRAVASYFREVPGHFRRMDFESNLPNNLAAVIGSGIVAVAFSYFVLPLDSNETTVACPSWPLPGEEFNPDPHDTEAIASPQKRISDQVWLPALAAYQNLVLTTAVDARETLELASISRVSQDGAWEASLELQTSVLEGTKEWGPGNVWLRLEEVGDDSVGFLTAQVAHFSNGQFQLGGVDEQSEYFSINETGISRGVDVADRVLAVLYGYDC